MTAKSIYPAGLLILYLRIGYVSEMWTEEERDKTRKHAELPTVCENFVIYIKMIMYQALLKRIKFRCSEYNLHQSISLVKCMLNCKICIMPNIFWWLEVMAQRKKNDDTEIIHFYF